MEERRGRAHQSRPVLSGAAGRREAASMKAAVGQRSLARLAHLHRGDWCGARRGASPRFADLKRHRELGTGATRPWGIFPSRPRHPKASGRPLQRIWPHLRCSSPGERRVRAERQCPPLLPIAPSMRQIQKQKVTPPGRLAQVAPASLLAVRTAAQRLLQTHCRHRSRRNPHRT